MESRDIIYIRTSVSYACAHECFLNEIRELRNGRLSSLSGKSSTVAVEVPPVVSSSPFSPSPASPANVSWTCQQPAWNESVLVYH